MTATALAAPRPADVSGIHARPGLGRLTTVELRKMVNTRAGFWMQVATVVLAVAVVIGRLASGTDSEHTFGLVLEFALKPAAVLLPVAGILLVTSEWTQRTGMITFALVPHRSRVIGAKIAAASILSFAMLVVCFGIAAAGFAAAGTGGWTGAGTLFVQCIPYICGGMITGVAFGAVVQSSAPAIVALFALPSAWLAITSLSLFGDSGPWTDTGRALAPLSREVVDATQWAQAGTSLALWMLLPLLIGIWRITRREVAA
jgi:ABC-type transport system involved in multi-copper enzyme maturation permease subunit